MLFLVSCLFPAAFIYYIFSFEREDRFSLYLSYAAGLVAALVAILVHAAASMLFSPESDSLIARMLFTLFGEYLLPLTLAYAALIFFLHSPPLVRVVYSIPRFFGILSLYVPFLIYKTIDLPDSWPRFFLPLGMLAVLFLAEFCIGRYALRNTRSLDLQDLLITLIPVFMALIVLASASALWYLCFPRLLVDALALGVILPSIALRLRKYR